LEISAHRSTQMAPGSLVAGRYRVEAEIATGGMGAVYRVVDQATGRKVALKRLLPDAGKTSAILFEREYHTLVGLIHPRIIEVYDYGRDDQGPYYTMELMDGEDLRTLAPMPFEVACRYLRDVASSLALLHARRLLHRDLSARNVRATSDGRCKLFDFGALASFGITGEVVGTPPGIPPEALTGMALDQRADLYGLGALAYYLLTRRQAYPARTLGELAEVWKTLPAPPSVHAPDPIPRELDDLVLSLLGQDPLARPATVAEVIERLNTIAGLPPDNEISGVVDSYLAGGKMVGRERQLTRLKRLVVRAMRNRGGTATIQHAPGIGGTRLLSELAIEARISGATVLQLDAESHRGPNAVARALLARLVDAAPNQVVEAAQHDLDILTWFYPPLAVRAGITAPRLDGSHNPGALRVRLQSALQTLFQRVSQDNVLVIAIDSAQRLDESSAAFVAALAQTSRGFPLFVVATVRQGETPTSPVGLRALNEAGTQIAIGALTPEETADWMRSLFGEVPNVGRIAAWLQHRSAGNPTHTLELARHLVHLEVIRYVEGTWVIPSEFTEADLPTAFEDLIFVRIKALSPRARALLEKLSVHRGGLSIRACVTLTPAGANEAFAALDELLHNGLLIGASHSYHFSQEQVREKLVATLPAETRRALHLQVGQALQAESTDTGGMLEAGWHYFHAGKDELGAELLGRAGLSLAFDADELPAAVPALEAALAAYKRLGRPRRELITLLVPLALAGYYADRRLARRYGDEAMALLMEETGVTRATRLRFLGPYLSVWLGLGVSLARYLVSPVLGFYAGFHAQMVSMMTVATALTGVATVCLDTKEAQRISAVITPLHVLGARHPVTLSSRFCEALIDVTQDHPGRALIRLKQVIRFLRDPKIMKGVPEGSRELIYGGALLAMGALESFRNGDAALECADKLDQLGLRLYDMVAAQVRCTYHALRGEIDQAEDYRHRVETHAIQHGSAWQAEVWAPASMILSYAITGDVIGMKRTAEQLEQLRAQVPSLSRFYELARGEYALLRGDLPATVEILGALVAQTTPGEFVGRAAATASLSSAYRALGQPQKGRDLCVATLAAASQADRSVVAHFLRVEIEILLADADLGDRERAVAGLDALIEEHSHAEGPVTLGTLHRTRAQLALQMGDTSAFAHHLSEMNRWFRPTRNPALIAQCEKLASQGASPGQRDGSASNDTAASRQGAERTGTGGSVLGQCFGPEQRAQRALALVIDIASGTTGYLFAMTDEGLRLVAPLHGDAPPAGLEESVINEMDAFVDEGDATVVSEVEGAGKAKRASPLEGHGHAISLLTARVRGTRVIVGAAALHSVDRPLRPVPARTLESIGDALYEAGDVVEYAAS